MDRDAQGTASTVCFLHGFEPDAAGRLAAVDPVPQGDGAARAAATLSGRAAVGPDCRTCRTAPACCHA